MQSAIEVIGAGLISHQANQSLKTSLSSQSLSAQDFYTQVLRLVYRLIFIFVAEERDLLKAPHTDETAFTIYQRFYSAARIRALAGRRGGSRHGDLWAQLLLLFQALHHGEPALGLPALGSFLFDPLNTPDINSCQLSNHDLLEAIRLLCYTRKNRSSSRSAIATWAPKKWAASMRPCWKWSGDRSRAWRLPASGPARKPQKIHRQLLHPLHPGQCPGGFRAGTCDSGTTGQSCSPGSGNSPALLEGM